MISSKVCIVLCAIMVLISVSNISVVMGYRKPPFNGSIFGKRNGGAGKILKIIFKKKCISNKTNYILI